MNSDTWKFENNICRCCHAEGFFHNLAEPRPFCGEMEVYADMIKDVFSIEVRPMPGALCELTYTICSSCVCKLREAMQFKKQVQSCEDRFINLYIKNKLKVLNKMSSAKVKEEPEIDFKEEYLELDDSINDFDSNNDADPDFNVNGDSNDEDTKSEDDVEVVRTKKGKGKGKTTTVQKKAVPVETSKEVGKKKALVKKKVGRKSTKFSLQPGDYKKTGDIYRCSRCDKEYQKMVSIRFHVKSKHYRIPRYICELCDKEFMTTAPFTIHKLEQHRIDDRHKCNACKAIFNSKIQLRKHTNSYHMLGEKYKCDKCDYEAYSFESLYKHKYKHKTVKEYKCNFCKKAFVRKTTLVLHERIHTGDKRKICTECGQAFVQKASLNYHMTRHHPEVNY